MIQTKQNGFPYCFKDSRVPLQMKMKANYSFSAGLHSTLCNKTSKASSSYGTENRRENEAKSFQEMLVWRCDTPTVLQ